MSIDFSTLITDRTDADFKHWEYLRNKGYANMSQTERAEWLSGSMKGSYNASDLNRVGEALNYLQDKLNNAGYMTYQRMFTAKTDWTVASIPTAEDLTYYLKCVSHIRDALTLFDETPRAPIDTGTLNIEEANNIEKILFDVETLITNMFVSRFYCNDLYSGEI